jgi:hypothetical protein
MALLDSGDREIMTYLAFLSEHGKTCRTRTCGICQTAVNICDLVTDLLFTNECYAEVRIAEARADTAVITSSQPS